MIIIKIININDIDNNNNNNYKSNYDNLILQ